nr:MAG TPA: hypothetical protein [Bacteriophage sp.]
MHPKENIAQHYANVPILREISHIEQRFKF